MIIRLIIDKYAEIQKKLIIHCEISGRIAEIEADIRHNLTNTNNLKIEELVVFKYKIWL